MQSFATKPAPPVLEPVLMAVRFHFGWETGRQWLPQVAGTRYVDSFGYVSLEYLRDETAD